MTETAHARSSDPAAGRRSGVQVIARALSLLDLLAARPEPLSLQEIARLADLPLSTTSRLLTDLAVRGYVEKCDKSRWRLGLTFLQYGSLVRDRIKVRERALPIMQVLFQHTGLTVNLSLRRGDCVIYVEHIYSPESGIRLSRQVGAEVPLHCSSGGKLFLAASPPAEVSSYIARTKLAPRTAFSISQPEKLIVELDRIRELGWSQDNQELEYGVFCVGAPVHGADGSILATITLISDTRMSARSERIREVLSAANAVSAAMGWLP